MRLFSPTPRINTNLKLVTIGFSHFCEKGRWALDLANEDYTEEVHTPALHLSSTLYISKKIPSATDIFEPIYSSSTFGYPIPPHYDETPLKMMKRKSITSVPKLLIRSQQTGNWSLLPGGSSGILQYVNTLHPSLQLYPPEIKGTIKQWENYFDAELGQCTTQWIFGILFFFSSDNKKEICKFLCQDQRTAYIEKFLFKIFGDSLFIPLMQVPVLILIPICQQRHNMFFPHKM